MTEGGTERDRTRRQLRTARMEAFSDGIFTIAGTLLVIEIAVPTGSTDLWHAVVEQWPSYLGYLVSFATIGAIWLAHSVITEYLDHASLWLMRLNLVLMLAVWGAERP
ncbi:TMEM175 family protein [Kitasatospora purpeofusca]|uniref:TMEM175 family protein n=1 Tax=Kitasatospora purpeofusca TaxID=67352 RepID=UPI0037F4C998